MRPGAKRPTPERGLPFRPRRRREDAVSAARPIRRFSAREVPYNGGMPSGQSDERPNDHGESALDIGDLDESPMRQFQAWLDAAVTCGLIGEPTAAALATADQSGRPSVRMVLVKEVGEGGIGFYSNYRSRKARELAVNPHAALVIYWEALARQVRVEGVVTRAPSEASRRYFETRPYGSQLSAWASPQSEVVADRTILERRVEELRRQYPRGRVPLPPHWGGFVLVPAAFEFWQGRDNRLHDRFRYELEGDWRLNRLAP